MCNTKIYFVLFSRFVEFLHHFISSVWHQLLIHNYPLTITYVHTGSHTYTQGIF